MGGEGRGEPRGESRASGGGGRGGEGGYADASRGGGSDQFDDDDIPF